MVGRFESHQNVAGGFETDSACKQTLKHLATECILHGRAVKNVSKQTSRPGGQLCKMDTRSYFCNITSIYILVKRLENLSLCVGIVSKGTNVMVIQVCYKKKPTISMRCTFSHPRMLHVCHIFLACCAQDPTRNF